MSSSYFVVPHGREQPKPKEDTVRMTENWSKKDPECLKPQRHGGKFTTTTTRKSILWLCSFSFLLKVCVCVYAHTCVFLCACVCVQVSISMCVSVSCYVLCVHVYVCVFARVFLHVCFFSVSSQPGFALSLMYAYTPESWLTSLPIGLKDSEQWHHP